MTQPPLLLTRERKKGGKREKRGGRAFISYSLYSSLDHARRRGGERSSLSVYLPLSGKKRRKGREKRGARSNRNTVTFRRTPSPGR